MQAACLLEEMGDLAPAPPLPTFPAQGLGYTVPRGSRQGPSAAVLPPQPHLPFFPSCLLCWVSGWIELKPKLLAFPPEIS